MSEFAVRQSARTSSRAFHTPRVLVPLEVRLLIGTVLFAVVFMTRFQLNIGSLFISFSLMAQYMMLVGLLAIGLITIEPVRLMLSIPAVAIVVISYIANKADSSITSLLLLAVTYAPFVFCIRNHRIGPEIWRWTMKLFANFALIVACAGILQFFLQFVIHAPWLFDFRPYIPEFLRNNNIYNTVIAADRFHKANGFFLLEPSSFSVLTALAILCELSAFEKRRRLRLAIFGFALLISYSGSGLVALAFGLMFPIRLKTFIRGTQLLLGGLVAFFVLGEVLNLDFTLHRINEFSTPGSSGYARYVGPMYIVRQVMDSRFLTFYIGHGPGTISDITKSFNFSFQIADPTWAKLLVEYGVLGFLFTLVFVAFGVFRSRSPAELKAAMFLGWVISGGYLLNASTTSLLFVLLSMWPRHRTPAFGAVLGREGEARRVTEVGVPYSEVGAARK